MNDLADLAPLLDPSFGCRFVFPNAPKPFEAGPGMTYGWTWVEGWPPQHASIGESRAEMLPFIDQVTEALRAKYPAGGSLDRMTRDEVLAHTLRLEPV